ncbi:hypothetical protein EDD16DRAFT_772519 [Pisolithus croceorrhizus]|nr:hypothetical protein EDD16DRAFT_772519 [Pisolithus croceorrhizus]
MSIPTSTGAAGPNPGSGSLTTPASISCTSLSFFATLPRVSHGVLFCFAVLAPISPTYLLLTLPRPCSVRGLRMLKLNFASCLTKWTVISFHAVIAFEIPLHGDAPVAPAFP